MSRPKEEFQFQSEARQLLDLMIHSVYSNREIFLRELISNSSDALDKLRFEALTHSQLADLADDLHIRIEADSAERTLTVSDNGIGMSRQEIIDFIGTIAKSGSREFLELLRQNKGKELAPELIGQFGVGFYSTFMVADRVELVTRKAGDEEAWRWESTGDGTYTLEPAVRDQPGTTIRLTLKPTDEEGGLRDFTEEWVLREIVRRYSDFVAYPIRMEIERSEVEKDEEGKPVEGGETKTVREDVTLNSMKAIWTRSEAEVTEEEYNEFYKHLSHDWNLPLARIPFKAEGTSEFRALLFIPSAVPPDLFLQEQSGGIHLYIKRVFIMNDAKELLPQWLRFLRGVVDSEDLSLNISRELLQKDRQVQIIQRALVRKVLDYLGGLAKDDSSKFLEFWKLFGTVVKEGIFSDFKNREAVLGLSRFSSTAGDQLTTIDAYIERMPDKQEAIYYITARSLESAKSSPHLERFKEKGFEVLLLADPVDEVWTQATTDYQQKPLRSIGKGEVDLGGDGEDEEEQRKEQQESLKSLLEALQSELSDDVKQVRLSNRLTESPACLVSEAHEMTPQMEQMLRAMGQDVPKTKRILELNPDHGIIQQLRTIHGEDANSPLLAEYAHLLFGQAMLAEGAQLSDPAGYSRRVAQLMAQALGRPAPSTGEEGPAAPTVEVQTPSEQTEGDEGEEQ